MIETLYNVHHSHDRAMVWEPHRRFLDQTLRFALADRTIEAWRTMKAAIGIVI